MRRGESRLLGNVCLLLMVCGTLAPCLYSQALASESDWKAVIRDISKNSRQIKNLKTQMESINHQGEQLAREQEAMNARSCDSSGARREDCASYPADEAMLDQQRKALLQEWQGDEEQLRSLQDQVNHLTARIRASRVLQGYEVWTDRLKKCAALPPIDAVACIAGVKEDHP